MTSAHTHLHANVQRTMPRAHIADDLSKLFGLSADTIGMCELETVFHHQMFRHYAKEHGYAIYLPSGPAGALGLAVKESYGEIEYAKSVRCVPGTRHVSPSRFINRVRVKRTLDGQRVNVAETHQYSSGWTGTRSLDAFRKARWYTGMRVVGRVERDTTNYNDVSIGAGDLNRPPGSFPNGVLQPMLSKKGMLSTGYAHTDHTHGPTTFDYLFFLSKKHNVHVAKWSTPALHSDHDAILATLEW